MKVAISERAALLARAYAASKRLKDANEELDAAERNHRILWEEFEAYERSQSNPGVPHG